MRRSCVLLILLGSRTWIWPEQLRSAHGTSPIPAFPVAGAAVELTAASTGAIAVSSPTNKALQAPALLPDDYELKSKRPV